MVFASKALVTFPSNSGEMKAFDKCKPVTQVSFAGNANTASKPSSDFFHLMF